MCFGTVTADAFVGSTKLAKRLTRSRLVESTSNRLPVVDDAVISLSLRVAGMPNNKKASGNDQGPEPPRVQFLKRSARSLTWQT